MTLGDILTSARTPTLFQRPLEEGRRLRPPTSCLARSHPFVDGNARMAVGTAAPVLDRNGCAPTAADAGCVATALVVVAGHLAEQAFAPPLRAHLEPIG